MKQSIGVLVLLLFLASCAYQAERSWYDDQGDDFKAYERMEEWLRELEREEQRGRQSFELWPDVLETVTRC